MADTRRAASRRSFLKGVAAFASVSIIPRHVLGAEGQTAASDKITHAVVGVGGMGMGHLDYVLGDKGARLIAVCDVDTRHLDAAQKKGAGCKGYHDFREMLDRGDVDVVHVPTPPHWHALVSIAALDAGCDVWCEKPMSRTIGEGQHVIDAVKRNGRVFRLNTWFRLNGGFYGFNTEVKPIKKLVMSGLLGWPLTVRVGPFTGFDWKLGAWVGRPYAKPEPIPAGFDYDFWLGPAPVKPYFAHRTHGSFRGYWDYDGGGLGDMGQHYLDPVQYLLNKDDTSPVEVEANAPWPPHPDACGVWGWIKMRYADGCEIILDSGSWGEPITKGLPYIEGPKGKL
ncbi:MAG: Gfo/Idh/MocA family oxidoreductase, partial [Planctomycetota bacterium]|nr:Gfo/Idh/MocA family oxidoreductase [Planctomycetota bacterium]